MPRRVPIALVLGLSLRLVATLALVGTGAHGWLARTCELIALLDSPASVAIAVGLWQARRDAAMPHLLAMASIAAWTRFGTDAVALVAEDIRRHGDTIRWLVDHVHHADVVLDAIAGALLAVAVERKRALVVIVAVVAVAMPIVSVVATEDNEFIEFVLIVVSIALQLAIAVRSVPAAAEDVTRAARGLSLAGLALWIYSGVVGFEEIGMMLIEKGNLLSHRGVDWVYALVAVAVAASLAVATAGLLGATGARVRASWLVAIAAILLAFAHADVALHSKWISLAIQVSAPIAAGAALVAVDRRELMTIGGALVAIAFGFVAVLVMPGGDPDTARFVFAVGQAAGFALLAIAARACARTLVRDPSAIARVFE